MNNNTPAYRERFEPTCDCGHDYESADHSCEFQTAPRADGGATKPKTYQEVHKDAIRKAQELRASHPERYTYCHDCGDTTWTILVRQSSQQYCGSCGRDK